MGRLIDEMDHTLQIPSFPNAWLFPIRTRIDMITTGIRTPVGIKVLGTKLDMIDQIGLEARAGAAGCARNPRAFFERVTGGYYVDFEVDRRGSARYGLTWVKSTTSSNRQSAAGHHDHSRGPGALPGQRPVRPGPAR